MQSEHAPPPFVSVIMPVRDEAAFIRHALDAVLAQDYPVERMEVLVVDGRSTDRTRDLVREIAGHVPRVHVLDNPGVIQAQALNIGLAAARGEVIVRVDGHTIIAPDYVRQCVRSLQDTGADTVGGPLRSVGITPLGRAIAVAYRSPFGVPSRYRISHRAEIVDQVYLGAWPREVFERVGTFDPALAVNEDYEHNYRIRKAGGRVFLTPAILSAYYGRQTLSELWRQYVRYGRGKLRVIAKYPASTRLRHLVAPLFVLVLIAGGVLALFSARIAQLWGAVVFAYGIANGAASLRQARRARGGVLFRLPFVFAVMHIAWGAGFWIELTHLLWLRIVRRQRA